MRGRTILLAALLAIGAQADLAQAQFSPQGFIGAVTRPLRQMLGRLGHVYGSHRRSTPRHRAVAAAGGTAAATAAASAGTAAGGQPMQLAASGLAAWPTAFEDIVGYTFWPNDYAAQVRGHGFDVVAATLTGTARQFSVARTAMANSVSKNDANNRSSSDACNSPPGGQNNWPASKIEQTTDLNLNDAQRAALGKLQTALTESEKTIAAGCRNTTPNNTQSSPADRLDATIKKIWAVRDAAIFIRAPLKDFYETLSDKQKEKFTWKPPQDAGAPANAPDNGKIPDTQMAKQYQMCAAPSLEASERVVKQIEQEVRPRKEQSASMEEVRKTSGDMAKLLTTPCGQPIPADPLARLDAASNQLSSMSYAATSTEIVLNGLQAQLDDKQKAKFNALGP